MRISRSTEDRWYGQPPSIISNYHQHPYLLHFRLPAQTSM